MHDDATPVSGSVPLPIEERAPVPALQRISAVLASEEREGAWVVPLALDLHVVGGSIELDLRGALVSSDLLEVDYSVILGSITIVVPPGVEVWCENDTTLGSFEHKRKPQAPQDGAGFRLELRGTNWLGSVEIREKAMPGTEQGMLASATRWLRLGRGGD